MNFADAACEPGLLEAVMPGKESLSWEEFCYDNSSYELNSKLQFCKFAKSCKPTSAPFKSELTSFTNTSRLACNLWNARDDNGLGLVLWIRNFDGIRYNSMTTRLQNLKNKNPNLILSIRYLIQILVFLFGGWWREIFMGGRVKETTR